MENVSLLDDTSVVTAIRSGDVDAFAEVVERYQVPIVRYLFRLTGDYELARDLAQDTFVQAYKGILRTHSNLRLKAWLYRIATNNAFQHRRRRRILSFISFEDWRKSSADRGDAGVPASEQAAIQQALSNVPSELRTCLVLHLVEGFRYGEIAETLGISEEAVRKRVARGKQAFRRMYGGGEDR